MYYNKYMQSKKTYLTILRKNISYLCNICAHCCKYPFLCIIVPCFPYIVYQNYLSNYQVKIDNDNNWNDLEEGLSSND